MGRIFTWKDIELKTIPSLMDFSTLRQALKELFTNSTAIIGAIECGSVPRGDHTIRSDYDVYVLYDYAQFHLATNTFYEIAKTAERLRIPLELIPINSRIACTSHHNITPSFIVHLQQSISHSGFIKANPLTHTVPNGISHIEDTKAYLAHKLKKFEKGTASLPYMSIERHHHFMQKVLEFPVYAARKMIRATDEKVDFWDKKSTAISEYEELFEGSTSVGILRKAVTLDAQYNTVLQNTIQSGELSPYKEILNDIEGFAPQVLLFAILNLEMLG